MSIESGWFPTLTDLPPEVRLVEIFPRASLRDCLRLPLVCKLLRDEVKNEFLKTRCLAHFPELASIPRFIEPLVASVKNPWGWICYSLSCKKVNESLYPVAEKIALSSRDSFYSYLLLQHVDRLDADQQTFKFLLDLDPETFDLDAEIKLAQEEFDSNWTDDNQEAFEELKDQIKERGLEQGFMMVYNEAKREATESLDPHLHPSQAIRKLMETDGPFLIAFEKRTTDPILIQMAKLTSKRISAHWKVASLRELRKCTKAKNVFEKILGTRLERCATTVFYHILFFLPHLKNWMPHFKQAKKLEKLLHKTTSQAYRLVIDKASVASEVKPLVDSLPDPFPQILWKELKKETGHQNLDNLGNYLRQLLIVFENYCDSYGVLRRELQKRGNFDLNPVLDFDLLKALLRSPSELQGIKFRYPSENPNLEEIKTKLEQGQPAQDALLPSGKDYFLLGLLEEDSLEERSYSVEDLSSDDDE